MSDASDPLTFLKLGGSLITDKDGENAAYVDVLQRLAGEIAAARRRKPRMRLLLGHGSGSFGHVPARRYGTRLGVRTPEEWQGFWEVWRVAAALNRLVMDALAQAGLPALAFPPSACVISRDGIIDTWNLDPLQAALEAGLIPVVYGDVAFDLQRGGTILSTEDLFEHLVRRFAPSRVLLAGSEAGVWSDYPACTTFVAEIRPDTLEHIVGALGGSAATDVTGGMIAKVLQSLRMAQDVPGLEVRIFSGQEAGAAERALAGESLGTLIHSP